METFIRLPGIGELTIEHSFYQVNGEPILFICKDALENRFLCSCYQIGVNWVVGHVEEKLLIAMINDRLTIREVFEKPCGRKWNVVWDGVNFRIDPHVPEEVFPQKGKFLELDREKDGQYLADLTLRYQQMSTKSMSGTRKEAL